MNLRLSDAHHAELVARAQSGGRSLQKEIVYELFQLQEELRAKAYAEHAADPEHREFIEEVFAHQDGVERGAALARAGATPSFGILSEGAEPAPQSGSPEKRGEGRRIPESAPTKSERGASSVAPRVSGDGVVSARPEETRSAPKPRPTSKKAVTKKEPKPRTAMCEHRVAAGSFCKRCGRVV